MTLTPEQKPLLMGQTAARRFIHRLATDRYRIPDFRHKSLRQKPNSHLPGRRESMGVIAVAEAALDDIFIDAPPGGVRRSLP
jgi:hypothetical protein